MGAMPIAPMSWDPMSTDVKNNKPQPVFSSRAVLMNFLVLVLCSQFAFAVLAMKGALLPQMLELWNISKTQFGMLMTDMFKMPLHCLRSIPEVAATVPERRGAFRMKTARRSRNG